MQPDTPNPNPVSAAVWPWARREQAAAPPARPSLPGLLAGAAAGLALAALLGLGFGWRHAGIAAATMSAVMLGLGLAAPALHAALVRRMLSLVHAVGAVLTAVLLPLAYFLVFLPVGLIRRLGGDPLGLRFPGPAGSLWQTRRPVASRDEYTRQF